MKLDIQQQPLSAVRLLLRLTMTSLLCLWVVPARAVEADEPPQWSFVPGRYQLIGRHPDSLLTYSGTARIDRVGEKLRLTREIAGKQSRVFGVVRRADPGEAYVLAFKWGKQRPMEMVCIIGGDLDNYPRLTCLWGREGNPHRQPGMEAYFAQEPWEPVRP